MTSKNKGRTRAESRARYYIREEAKRRGWNVGHLASGGNFLEENEILNSFPQIGLGLEKPDFLVCYAGEPVIVVEAKNQAGKIGIAIQEAIDYADLINATGLFQISIAVGAAGEEDTGFVVETRYLTASGWVPLQSKGSEITNFPSPKEVELARLSNSGSTDVSVPASHEFTDAAIELSGILRAARVEAFLRPKVIGSLVLSMYQGTIDTDPQNALSSINTLVESGIRDVEGLTDDKRNRLLDALRLSIADFDRLAPSVGRIVSILRRLNVRAVLQTDTDFLGLFYEAFLRYGYDNNALGIVFTPRHITRFCVELVGVDTRDRVIDIASGTGGFLVAAFDEMMEAARDLNSPAVIDQIKSSIAGFDTNPTVWALAMLNMFFRGDGKSQIEQASSLDLESRDLVRGRFTRAFLNPPFSQDNEPERDFVNAAMDSLEPGGILTAVVAAGIFADDEHRNWRREFLRNHSLLAMISLPEDLFYPTSAPTSILMAKAHIPQNPTHPVFMARVWQDGYEKLKGRRIERGPNQLPQIKSDFQEFSSGQVLNTERAVAIQGAIIQNGGEWSPQQWLPQSQLLDDQSEALQNSCVLSTFQAAARFLELADAANTSFISSWTEKPPLPIGERGDVLSFFEVKNGKSQGEKNYGDGECPYISSGDASNSIVRLVQAQEEECFEGGLTVTAFGQACLQPWKFMARGNGGSAVRILVPRFNISVRELVWFAAQINAQRWRFFYARMSIKSRLERLEIQSPLQRLPDIVDLAMNIHNYRNSLRQLSDLGNA